MANNTANLGGSKYTRKVDCEMKGMIPDAHHDGPLAATTLEVYTTGRGIGNWNEEGTYKGPLYEKDRFYAPWKAIGFDDARGDHSAAEMACVLAKQQPERFASVMTHWARKEKDDVEAEEDKIIPAILVNGVDLKFFDNQPASDGLASKRGHRKASQSLPANTLYEKEIKLIEQPVEVPSAEMRHRRALQNLPADYLTGEDFPTIKLCQGYSTHGSQDTPRDTKQPRIVQLVPPSPPQTSTFPCRDDVAATMEATPPLTSNFHAGFASCDNVVSNEKGERLIRGRSRSFASTASSVSLSTETSRDTITTNSRIVGGDTRTGCRLRAKQGSGPNQPNIETAVAMPDNNFMTRDESSAQLSEWLYAPTRFAKNARIMTGQAHADFYSAMLTFSDGNEEPVEFRNHEEDSTAPSGYRDHEGDALLNRVGPAVFTEWMAGAKVRGSTGPTLVEIDHTAHGSPLTTKVKRKSFAELPKIYTSLDKEVCEFSGTPIEDHDYETTVLLSPLGVDMENIPAGFLRMHPMELVRMQGSYRQDLQDKCPPVVGDAGKIKKLAKQFSVHAECQPDVKNTDIQDAIGKIFQGGSHKLVQEKAESYVGFLHDEPDIVAITHEDFVEALDEGILAGLQAYTTKRDQDSRLAQVKCVPVTDENARLQARVKSLQEELEHARIYNDSHDARLEQHQLERLEKKQKELYGRMIMAKITAKIKQSEQSLLQNSNELGEQKLQIEHFKKKQEVLRQHMIEADIEARIKKSNGNLFYSQAVESNNYNLKRVTGLEKDLEEIGLKVKAKQEEAAQAAAWRLIFGPDSAAHDDGINWVRRPQYTRDARGITFVRVTESWVPTEPRPLHTLPAPLPTASVLRPVHSGQGVQASDLTSTEVVGQELVDIISSNTAFQGNRRIDGNHLGDEMTPTQLGGNKANAVKFALNPESACFTPGQSASKPKLVSASTTVGEANEIVPEGAT